MSNKLAQSIALVGLSGSGKSAVGRRLAARLGLPLLDTDALVVETAMCSIAQIFATAGEPHFRELEAAALQTALHKAPCIIATGAGIVLASENCAVLKAKAFVVWLDAPTETLVARLAAHDEERPLLAEGMAERLEALRVARLPLYTAIAALRIATNRRTVEAICEEVIMNMRQAAQR